MKIIDKIHEYLERDSFFYSFEYFPPKTDAGCVNLYERMERMKELNPAWVGVTWGAGGKTAKETLEICATAQNLLGIEALMHVTCTNTPLDILRDTLRQAREEGIQNIFALRGAQAVEGSHFKHVPEFIRWVKKEHGDYFGIVAAAYPEGHEEASSYEDDLKHLKEKIDAGADLLVTQLFYDVDVFLSFTLDCRRIGIKCPIIPGVMPINTFHQFARMKKMFCTRDTPAIRELSEKISGSQQDDNEVKDVGVKEVAQLVKKLMRKGVRGFHFFTQNLEKSVTRILTDPLPEGLGLLDDGATTGLPCQAPDARRDLPWRRSANVRRSDEEVRPAFWSNRQKSYMAKTMAWDDFPNGRWGDSRSPAFGEDDYSHTSISSHTQQWLKAGSVPWPSDASFADICSLFVRSLYGGPALPWFDNGLSPESSRILNETIAPMNRHGLLTINSQPGVNAEPSETRDVGWGPKGGYVYQKAYIEFFCSPETAQYVFSLIKGDKYDQLTFMAANSAGDSEANHDGVTAVTWGVFPGKEIVQPTIVDTASFAEWRKEAFALWLVPYRPGEERFCPKVVQEVYTTFWLVHIVDNDFVKNEQLRSAVQEIMARCSTYVQEEKSA